MKIFIIEVGVMAPFPRKFLYREEATHIAVALNRALKKCKKELGRKKVAYGKYNISVVQG